MCRRVHHHSPRGGERATGCVVPRPPGQADRRDVPRRRRGPDPGRERDRQPGQAAAPRTARRRERAAARVEVAPRSHRGERRDEARRLARLTNPHGCAESRISGPLLTFKVRRGSAVRVRQRALSLGIDCKSDSSVVTASIAETSLETRAAFALRASPVKGPAMNGLAGTAEYLRRKEALRVVSRGLEGRKVAGKHHIRERAAPRSPGMLGTAPRDRTTASTPPARPRSSSRPDSCS